MRNDCVLYPLGKDGKPSQLYKDLLKYTGNRPMANYFYAAYTTSVAAQMDSNNFVRNQQGEHSIADVEKALNLVDLKKELGSQNVGVERIARMEGTIDSQNIPIDFTDAKKALDKAQKINNTYKGIVAAVYSKGDKFNIVLEAKTSRTHMRSLQVDKQLQQWSVLSHAMNSIGIDINTADLRKSIFNAVNAKDAIQWISNVQNTDNKYLSKGEIKDLLVISEDSSQVKRLKQLFGSLDDVAQKIYESYRGGSVTNNQMTLIEAALNTCKKFKNLDITALKKQLSNIDNNLSNTEEASIEATLQSLNKQYKIDFNEVLLIGNRIRSLSRAASEAAVTLQRQLNQIVSTQGVTPEALRVEKTLSIITKELSGNNYYAGLLGFLGEATLQIQQLETLIKNTPQSGTNLEKAAALSSTLMQVKRITEGYEHILKALSKADTILTDEDMSTQEIQNLKDQASKLVGFFDKYKNVIEDLKVENMTNIATEFLGDKLPNGEAVVNIVSMANADSSIYDILYSMGTVSNPLIAVMGNIIRDAQSGRDAKMNDISLRIRRAENALRKSGSTSAFMYENNGYIISDIDWNTYIRHKNTHKMRLEKLGYKGLSLKEAMDNWEEANTEDRVVDKVSGRTERVPNSNYRKPFPQLTKEQQEYYDTMMQIKGELGTLLPPYAQRQYVPPQIRRSFWDATRESIKNGDFKGIVKALRNKFKDLVTIREDDTRYGQQGTVNTEEYTLYSGTMDNTPFRQIPIFFINKINDSNELFKDFSSAIQHLAGTAINYEAMNNIKDTVEFMQDYIVNQEVAASDGSNQRKAELIENNGIRIFKSLTAFSNKSNTISLVNGFINSAIYGEHVKIGKWHYLLRNLIQYTSIKNLALNVKGMISNATVGNLQLIIEAGGGEFFGFKDLAWAEAKLFGNAVTKTPGEIVDWVTNSKNSKAALLGQLFDPTDDNFERASHKRYDRGIINKLISTDLSMIGYGAGDAFLRFTTMYAVLHNTKVKLNDKEVSLYDIFNIQNNKDGNSELVFDKNATYTNNEGKEVPIDNVFIQTIRKKIRYVNQTTQGAMNTEDKGYIQQYMAGRLILNMRQWMIEHYARRYRSKHWDARLEEYREGFYRTTFDFAADLFKDAINLEFQIGAHWNKLDTLQKANVRRALTELSVLSCLLTLGFALGEPDEHKRGWWLRMFMYQVKRSTVDVNGSTPWGIPMEMNTLINSPVAATNTVNSLLYPFVCIDDIGETIKSGPHKGENKYWRNIKKYTVPFYGQLEQIYNMGEDESVFNIFNKNIMQK